jgi:hypothetical protein
LRVQFLRKGVQLPKLGQLMLPCFLCKHSSDVGDRLLMVHMWRSQDKLREVWLADKINSFTGILDHSSPSLRRPKSSQSPAR